MNVKRDVKQCKQTKQTNTRFKTRHTQPSYIAKTEELDKMPASESDVHMNNSKSSKLIQKQTLVITPSFENFVNSFSSDKYVLLCLSSGSPKPKM